MELKVSIPCSPVPILSQMHPVHTFPAVSLHKAQRYEDSMVLPHAFEENTRLFLTLTEYRSRRPTNTITSYYQIKRDKS